MRSCIISLLLECWLWKKCGVVSKFRTIYFARLQEKILTLLQPVNNFRLMIVTRNIYEEEGLKHNDNLQAWMFRIRKGKGTKHFLLGKGYFWPFEEIVNFYWSISREPRRWPGGMEAIAFVTFVKYQACSNEKYIWGLRLRVKHLKIKYYLVFVFVNLRLFSPQTLTGFVCIIIQVKNDSQRC